MKKVISVTLEESILREIDRMAKALRRSRSAMMENALQEWLEDQKLGLQAFTNPLVTQALMGVFKDREVLRTLAAAMGERVSEEEFQKIEGLFAQVEKSQKKRESKKAKKGGK